MCRAAGLQRTGLRTGFAGGGAPGASHTCGHARAPSSRAHPTSAQGTPDAVDGSHHNGQRFNYLFYVDFVGSLTDVRCQNALRHLQVRRGLEAFAAAQPQPKALTRATGGGVFKTQCA